MAELDPYPGNRIDFFCQYCKQVLYRHIQYPPQETKFDESKPGSLYREHVKVCDAAKAFQEQVLEVSA